MSSTKKKKVLCFFISNLYGFYFFSCLIVLIRMSRTMLSHSGQSGYHCLQKKKKKTKKKLSGQKYFVFHKVWCELQIFSRYSLLSWESALKIFFKSWISAKFWQVLFWYQLIWLCDFSSLAYWDGEFYGLIFEFQTNLTSLD